MRKAKTVLGRAKQTAQSLKRRDVQAASLQRARFRPRVVRSAKVYSRKVRPVDGVED